MVSGAEQKANRQQHCNLHRAPRTKVQSRPFIIINSLDIHEKCVFANVDMHVDRAAFASGRSFD